MNNEAEIKEINQPYNKIKRHPTKTEELLLYKREIDKKLNSDPKQRSSRSLSHPKNNSRSSASGQLEDSIKSMR